MADILSAITIAGETHLTMPSLPLTEAELEDRLDQHVEAVLSIRRTARGPAAQLATLARPQQEYVLGWVATVAKSNPEMAFQLAAYAAQAIESMDEGGVQAWIIDAMDIFDKQGMIPGIATLRDVETFGEQRAARATGLGFDEVARVLQHFVGGLNGRTLALAPSDEVYTDTETLYLPPELTVCARREQNFALFKAMAVHQWAQTWYGTWRADASFQLRLYADAGKALRWFHKLEAQRLDARIAQDYPGLSREMRALRETLDAGESTAYEGLSSEHATVWDSWKLVATLYHQPLPPSSCYQGLLFPDRVEAVRIVRKNRERDAFKRMLLSIAKRGEENEQTSMRAEADKPPKKFSLSELPEGPLEFELRMDDRPVTVDEDVQALMSSILQDLGEIPDDYLVPAGPGDDTGQRPDAGADPDDVWKGTYHEQGVFHYDEWDFARQHYRKGWCVLRERDAHPQWNNFVDQTLHRHRGLVKSLRRTFEALRGEDKLLRKEPHGPDIDIDAFVESYADARNGQEVDTRLFLRRDNVERDIAVMFMVDMSGSTKGWINDAEREALVLLCEALETLGDRYAIYGFSGMTRKRCEVYRIKRFDEHYSDLVQARISGILPQDYTRMGVVIRHLTALLKEVDARTKLLVTLSDGKPDDYTDYRGEYGVEDTRQALFETRQEGIHPFCVTIDDRARDYLPHMYGTVNYALIDDVRKLPLKLSDIYRKLTS